MTEQIPNASKQSKVELNQGSEEKKENAFLNIAINVIAPWLILSKLSKPEMLGPFWSLIVALAMPVSYGIYDFATRKKYNVFSIIGFASTLLTGVIGLMQLNRNWMVAKETAVPLLFGILTVTSKNTSWAIVPAFLGQALDLEQIEDAFKKQEKHQMYDYFINFSTYSLAGSFLLSAILNFILAIWVLKGEPGSPEFNESLGQMTGLSFPVIVAPMMLVMGFIFYRIFNILKEHAGLDMEDVIKHK